MTLPARGAGALSGRRAPWFRLKSITGKTVTNKTIRGRPAIIVVGRSFKSAPPCKKWILELAKLYGAKAAVHQVIVADKPWYIPRSAVLKKIRNFTPPAHRHRVLVEWYKVFAKVWNVPQHDHPTIFVIDAKGVVRLRMRGKMTTASLRRVHRAVHSRAKQRSR